MANYHVELKSGMGNMQEVEADGVRQSSTGDYEFFMKPSSATAPTHIVAAVPKESVRFIVEKR